MLCTSQIRAIQLQLQLGLILKPGNLAGPHSLQIKHIGLVFGFGSKIKKYFPAKAELNLRFSLSILYLRVEKNMFLEVVS